LTLLRRHSRDEPIVPRGFGIKDLDKEIINESSGWVGNKRSKHFIASDGKRVGEHQLEIVNLPAEVPVGDLLVARVEELRVKDRLWGLPFCGQGRELISGTGDR
jgi:hypothetical protein